MARQLKVVVDKSRCVSNQMCMQYAGGVFEPDADGKSHVVDLTAAPEEAIIEAAYNCPVAAISVFDAETGAAIVD
jgi:ferredoxin